MSRRECSRRFDLGEVIMLGLLDLIARIPFNLQSSYSRRGTESPIFSFYRLVGPDPCRATLPTAVN
jgi:hypothetical protein